MSLGAALRDRARVIKRQRSGTQNAEGGFTVSNLDGPSFRCLYDEGNESETRDQAKIRRVRPATLLVGRRALDGTALDIKAKDVVEIIKKMGGIETTILMEVVGDPKVIPKRRTVIGYTIELQKVNRA